MTVTNLNPPTFHAWMSDAACSEYPGDMWFVENGGSHALDNARNICEGCPVRKICLQHALDNGEGIGMWGAKTPRQRKAIRNNENERRRGRRQAS